MSGCGGGKPGAEPGGHPAPAAGDGRGVRAERLPYESGTPVCRVWIAEGRCRREDGARAHSLRRTRGQ